MRVSVDQAAELIINGDVVAFPTETVYGLGADAKNVNAIKKTFLLKGRPSDNPLIVHVSNLDQVSELAANIPSIFDLLAKAFWPGPITFVLKKKSSVPDLVTAGLDTVAIRMPNHPIALKLIRKTGPLTAPSANKSGKPSPTKIDHLLEDYHDELHYIDGGQCKIGVESTVLDLTVSPPVILRPGAISKEMIEDVTQVKIVTERDMSLEQTPKSPGTKYTHYKPKADVQWMTEIPIEFDSNSYYIIHSLDKPMSDKNIISFNGDFNSMARQLYDLFRTADHLGYAQIWIEALPKKNNHPLLSPLFNRISKAISG